MEALTYKPKIFNIQVCQTAGRPLFSGKDPNTVIPILEMAFSVGCSVEEACSLAMISTSAYYRFLKKQPELRDRFRGLQTITIFNARRTIAVELAKGTNWKLAWKYMVARRPEEFSSNWVLKAKYDRLEKENRILKEKIGRLIERPSN